MYKEFNFYQKLLSTHIHTHEAERHTPHASYCSRGTSNCLYKFQENESATIKTTTMLKQTSYDCLDHGQREQKGRNIRRKYEIDSTAGECSFPQREKTDNNFLRLPGKIFAITQS